MCYSLTEGMDSVLTLTRMLFWRQIILNIVYFLMFSNKYLIFSNFCLKTKSLSINYLLLKHIKKTQYYNVSNVEWQSWLFLLLKNICQNAQKQFCLYLLLNYKSTIGNFIRNSICHQAHKMADVDAAASYFFSVPIMDLNIWCSWRFTLFVKSPWRN